MKFSNIRFIDTNAKERSSYTGKNPYNEQSNSSIEWKNVDNTSSSISITPEIIEAATHTGDILISSISNTSYSFFTGVWEYGVINGNSFVSAEYSNSTPIENMIWKKVYNDVTYYFYKQPSMWYIGTSIYTTNNYDGCRFYLSNTSYVPFNIDNLNSLVSSSWYDNYGMGSVTITSKPAEVINENVKLNVSGSNVGVDGEFSLQDRRTANRDRVWTNNGPKIFFDYSSECWVLENSNSDSNTLLFKSEVAYETGLSPETALKNIPAHDDLIDNCLYILKKYPSIARSSSIISPTNMTQSNDGDWSVEQLNSAGAQYNAFNVFNGNNDSGNGYMSSSEVNISSQNPCWILLKNNNQSICVKSYSIKPLYNSSDSRNYNPEKWILEASNDGEIWVTIDERDISETGWSTSDFNKKTFNTNNNISYSQYRLSVSKTNTTNRLSIGLIEFYDNVYYDDNYYTLPIFGEPKGGITKIAFVGCPEPGDRFWDVLTEKNASDLTRYGWVNSGNKYATVYCSTVNSVNFAVNSKCEFYTENIDYIRSVDSNYFDTAETSTNNRYMLRFDDRMRILSIRNCRFSAWGVNIDDDRYLSQTSPMKCCAYVYAKSFIDKLVIENNIINYLPETYSSSETRSYDGFRFDGYIVGAYVSNNKCYMTKSDATSWVSGNEKPRYMIRLNSSTTGRTTEEGNYLDSASRFICFNNNSLVIRVNGYKNLNGWFYCYDAEKIEFVGNRITQGRDMGEYNNNEMNLSLYDQCLVRIMQQDSLSSYYRKSCYDYFVKDFYANIPSLWSIRNGYVLSLNFAANVSSSVYSGYNRYSKKNVIDNIVILLGEGPEKNSISSSNLNTLNTWTNYGVGSNTALYINGLHFNNSGAYNYYSNQSNIATNIKVYHPWGVAAFLRNIYATLSGVRGGIIVGTSSYVNVDKMSIKNARNDSIRFYDGGPKHLEINELFVEDKSLNDYVTLDSTMSGEIIINKTNHQITSTSSVFSGQGEGPVGGGVRNEFFVVQKDIGDNHGFLLKSSNKFIESCNIKHNSNSTLKMFGIYNNYYSLKLLETGNSGLLARDVMPGKYRVRINMAITGTSNGSHLYENSISNPKSDNRNVLLCENLTIGIKTKYGELSSPDNVSINTDENNGWDTLIVTPFYQEYYVDIYEPQTIYATIERFNVYSEGFGLSATTEAIYLDPEIEVIKIGEIEYSNSFSESNGEQL